MRMRLKLLLSLALSIAAMAWAGAAGAQDAGSAKAFLESAYQHYGKGDKGINQTGPEATLYFHSTLIALIKADIKAVGDDIPIAVDADLLCDCQDWNGIYDLKIDIQPDGANRAWANVSFALSDDKHRKSDSWRKLRFHLAAENGQWRIYDIFDGSGSEAQSGLRSKIQKELEFYARNAKSKPVN
jgi:hypothetical protein